MIPVLEVDTEKIDELEGRVEVLEECVATLSAMLSGQIGYEASKQLVKLVGCEVVFDATDESDED